MHVHWQCVHGCGCILIGKHCNSTIQFTVISYEFEICDDKLCCVQPSQECVNISLCLFLHLELPEGVGLDPVGLVHSDSGG